ncbi:MAG: PorT family protein [Bacteroidales bacterium]|jgi:hypothetical protein|nr:PorT family protein [Bacteroidales bacterium]
MKKLFLFITITFFFYQLAHSQKFIGSLIFGGNTTQIEGDAFKGFNKFGFNAGASVSLAFNKRQTWFATVELLYTQKGSHLKSLVDSMYYPDKSYIDQTVPYNEKVKYHLAMDYVEVPVMFHFEDPRTGVAFGLGFSWGRLVRISELENGYMLKTSLGTGTYKRDDWAALVDVKFKLYKNLKFNIRFQHSIAPIRTRAFVSTNEVRGQVHQVLTLRLIYSFNEKYKLNTRMDKTGQRMGAKWIRDIDD